jgi:predicted transcriptional regulator
LPTREETIKVMGVILREVSREPLPRSVLGDRVIPKGVSHATFEATFDFLARDGNVEKCGPEHRAHYRITGKGLKFLVWRGIA